MSPWRGMASRTRRRGDTARRRRVAGSEAQRRCGGACRPARSRVDRQVEAGPGGGGRLERRDAAAGPDDEEAAAGSQAGTAGDRAARGERAAPGLGPRAEVDGEQGAGRGSLVDGLVDDHRGRAEAPVASVLPEQHASTEAATLEGGAVEDDGDVAGDGRRSIRGDRVEHPAGRRVDDRPAAAVPRTDHARAVGDGASASDDALGLPGPGQAACAGREAGRGALVVVGEVGHAAGVGRAPAEVEGRGPLGRAVGRVERVEGAAGPGRVDVDDTGRGDRRRHLIRLRKDYRPLGGAGGGRDPEDGSRALGHEDPSVVVGELAAAVDVAGPERRAGGRAQREQRPTGVLAVVGDHEDSAARDERVGGRRRGIRVVGRDAERPRPAGVERRAVERAARGEAGVTGCHLVGDTLVAACERGGRRGGEDRERDRGCLGEPAAGGHLESSAGPPQT